MNIRDFYDVEQRRQSTELELGEGWTVAGDRNAGYRLRWVETTGEVYAVREPHRGGLLARYLDQLHVDDPDADELRVEILASGLTEAQVRTALTGWEQAESESDSLAWVRARLQPSPA